MSEVTPKSLVLDLLRVAEPRPIPVRAFVAIGSLFGLTGNATRVAVARLVSAGLVEADDPGSYRLAPHTSPVSAHVEGWRYGEKRIRDWDGAWLVVSLARGVKRGSRQRSVRALTLLGFRESAGSWVRPDNLAATHESTHEELFALGLEARAGSLVATELDERLEKTWRALWSTRELERSYAAALDRIERSVVRLDRLSPGEAAVETFLVGGKAIRILATDPLLPREIIGVCSRKKLWEAMLSYDILGRRVWGKLLGSSGLGAAPTHMGAMVGSA